MAEIKPLASLSSGLLARKGAAKPAMRRQGLSAFSSNDTPMPDFQDDLGWNDMGYDVDPQHEKNAEPVDAEALKNANPLMGAVPEVVRQRDDLADRLKASDTAAHAAGEMHRPDDAPLKQDSPDEPEDLISETDVDTDTQPSFRETLSSTGAPIALENSPLAVKKSAVRTPSDMPAHLPVHDESDHAADSEASLPAIKAVPRPRSTKAKAPATSPGKRAAFTLRVDPERHLKLRLACALGNVSAQQFVTDALDAYLKTVPELDDLANKVPAHRN